MHHLTRRLFLLVFAMLGSIGDVNAQILQKDTLQISKKYELMEYSTDPEQLDFVLIDSTQNRHKYMHFLNLQDVERNVLGYRGQTVQNLVFKPYEKLGFDLGYHQLDLYRYDYDNVYYYDNDAPLTRLTYVLGFKEEQAFHINHSQKIKQRFNVNVDFQRLTSRGNLGVDKSRRPDLFRQGATSINLFSELWYRSLNGKYNAAFSFLKNENEVNEHGGVTEENRVWLRDSLTTNRNLLITNYDDARRGQEDKHFRFRQSIDFGPYYQQPLNDSVDIQKLDPKFRIYHSSEFVDEYASYQDLRVDSMNYDTIVYNPLRTIDTLEAQRWIHRAGVNFLLGKNDFSKYTGQVKAGLKYESIYVRQESNHLYGFRTIGEYFDNTLFESRFDLRKKDIVGLRLKGVFNYGIEGLNKGDLNYEANLGYELAVGGLSVWNVYSNRHPSQLFYRYETNHSPYARGAFQNIEINRLGASLSFNQQPIKVSLENSTINNWLLFQTDGKPVQIDETINLTSLQAETNFHFGKWHVDSNIRLQTTNDSSLGLPNFLGMAAVYYVSPLFENALVMDAGLTVRYWSEYPTLAYTPHLGQFALDDTRHKTYPIVDLFANFQIKRVSVYVKTEHLSQGLGGNVYFPTSIITGADRNVRFGFAWLFYD